MTSTSSLWSSKRSNRSWSLSPVLYSSWNCTMKPCVIYIDSQTTIIYFCLWLTLTLTQKLLIQFDLYRTKKNKSYLEKWWDNLWWEKNSFISQKVRADQKQRQSELVCLNERRESLTWNLLIKKTLCVFCDPSCWQQNMYEHVYYEKTLKVIWRSVWHDVTMKQSRRVFEWNQLRL